MKKIIINAIAFLFLGATFGQGTLPMTWSFDDGTTPTGFSAYQGPAGSKLVYTSSNLINSAPNALRLDYTGEYVQAHWAGKADTITFYLAGTYYPDPGWQGTVTIDESADGQQWTTVKTFTDNVDNNATQHTVRVSSTARYFRIYYKTKASGYNLAIDDIVIKPKAPGQTPELKVYYNGEEQIHEGTALTGNDTLIEFTMENKGINQTLDISAITLYGADASDFQILNSVPFSIGAASSEKLQIRLTDLAVGTHTAAFAIASNDPDRDTFKLTFSTISGEFATEPTAQPAGLNITAKAFMMTGSATKSDAENYLVLSSIGSSTDEPVDGVSYQRGEYIGNARVIYSGSDISSLNFDGIVANTNYSVRVFAFNGYGKWTNYLLNNPLTKDVTTPGLSAGNYYDGIDPENSTFVSDLRALINPHRRIYYSNYSSYIVDNFEAHDTTDGQRIVEGFYSGYPHIYSSPFNHNVMSREHTYPYSYMGQASKDSANYSDLYILYTCHQNKVNAVRSNYPLNNLASITSEFYGGKFGKDSAGNFAYEPRDFAKGIAARGNFYICAAYHTEANPFTIPTSNQFVTELQDQYVLKRWNNDFPPSKWEIARAEYIAQSSVQGNRNPFIDNPDWACYIDFATMMHNPSGSCTPNQQNKKVEMNAVEINVYPNPSQDIFHVDLNQFNGIGVEVYVLDFYERNIFEGKTNNNSIDLDASQWASGSYLLLIRDKNGVTAAQSIVKP